jgi:hypothetical protein
LQGEAGTTNSQTPFTLFCSETPISQPISPTPKVRGEQTGTGKAGMTPRAKGTKKPSTPKALSVGDKLSVFDIHNTFRCHWFLSRDHLMANAILAQKAKDGKIFWVKFAPQFHTHLVKCTVALVPHPLHKVKKVMFGYILELLNGEGPQAFFNLTMGMWQATQAQKENVTEVGTRWTLPLMVTVLCLPFLGDAYCFLSIVSLALLSRPLSSSGLLFFPCYCSCVAVVLTSVIVLPFW